MEGSSWTGLLGLAWRTGIVIVAILVLAALVQRFSPRLARAQGRHLQVIERLALGPQRSLYLIVVGGRLLLIGGTDHEMRLLTEVEPEELNEKPLAGLAPLDGGRGGVAVGSWPAAALGGWQERPAMRIAAWLTAGLGDRLGWRRPGRRGRAP